MRQDILVVFVLILVIIISSIILDHMSKTSKGKNNENNTNENLNTLAPQTVSLSYNANREKAGSVDDADNAFKILKALGAFKNHEEEQKFKTQKEICINKNEIAPKKINLETLAISGIPSNIAENFFGNVEELLLPFSTNFEDFSFLKSSGLSKNKIKRLSINTKEAFDNINLEEYEKLESLCLSGIDLSGGLEIKRDKKNVTEIRTVPDSAMDKLNKVLPKLTELKAINCNFTFAHLVKILDVAQSLTSLDLSYNAKIFVKENGWDWTKVLNFFGFGMAADSKNKVKLKLPDKLKSLKFECCNLDGNDLEIFANLNNLEEISLSNNYGLNCNELGFLISNDPSVSNNLKKIDLRNCFTDDNNKFTLNFLIDLLTVNPLETLKISNNTLDLETRLNPLKLKPENIKSKSSLKSLEANEIFKEKSAAHEADKKSFSEFLEIIAIFKDNLTNLNISENLIPEGFVFPTQQGSILEKTPEQAGAQVADNTKDGNSAKLFAFILNHFNKLESLNFSKIDLSQLSTHGAEIKDSKLKTLKVDKCALIESDLELVIQKFTKLENLFAAENKFERLTKTEELKDATTSSENKDPEADIQPKIEITNSTLTFVDFYKSGISPEFLNNFLGMCPSLKSIKAENPIFNKDPKNNLYREYSIEELKEELQKLDSPLASEQTTKVAGSSPKDTDSSSTSTSPATGSASA